MNQTVEVIERKFGYFPAKFRLGEKEEVVNVDAVERCWTEMTKRAEGTTYHFKIRCGSEHYYLTEDGNSSRCTSWSEAEGLY